MYINRFFYIFYILSFNHQKEKLRFVQVKIFSEKVLLWFLNCFYCFYFLFTGSIDSKHFDVTLIIVLVRNLSHAITPPEKGYDVLPASTEKTPGSDLARIKYYRNFLAHKHDNSIESTYFKTAWKDISDVRKILKLLNTMLKKI